MITSDAHETFSDSQAVTSTAISDVIDLGADDTLKNLGAGEELYLVIYTNTAATASGSATVAFTLESDSTADLATSATTHWTSSAIGKATLTAGYRVVAISLPIEHTYERYLGVRYTVASGPLTAGAFTAYLTRKPQSWAPSPDGIA